ncbi:hypothetical protein NPIL_674001 [Nephila pilipes]|uniref:Uncharacterized protein n=1 Tax=Nephila pilipes TaxID=299642 RepID=A0A8X6QSR5_NEPPI|nr:hypothetical protein NPIL_674001 [Nephila pilipes]
MVYDKMKRHQNDLAHVGLSEAEKIIQIKVLFLTVGFGGWSPAHHLVGAPTAMRMNGSRLWTDMDVASSVDDPHSTEESIDSSS